MKKPSLPSLHVAFLTLFSLTSAGLAQGPLPPPGPLTDPFADRALDGSGNPVPSMKTLTQTDPGQPIPSRDADLPPLNGSAAQYTISKPGHYYLTENLTKPIRIESNEVTLDLRGYLIEYQAPIGGGGGAGLIAIDSRSGNTPYENITVRNGHIRGSWSVGVRLGATCRVHDLQVSYCQTYAIQCGNGSTVEQCTVKASKPQNNPEVPAGPGYWSGISCGDGAIIRGCTADSIAAIGIAGLQGSRISDCVAVNNLGCGIVANSSSTLSGCVAARNGATGIDVNTQVTLLNCTAMGNFNEGFHIRGGCALSNCASRENREEGFLAEKMTFAGNPNPPEPNTAVNFLQCVAQKNAWDGFNTDIDCLFTHCTADNNGSPAPQPGQPAPPLTGTNHGFHFTDGCQFLNCLAVANLADGYKGGTNNRIEASTARNNGAWGIEIGNDQNLVIRNFLRSNTAGTISVPPGNGIAPVTNAAAATPSSNLSF
jgi:hypothetical protein